MTTPPDPKAQGAGPAGEVSGSPQDATQAGTLAPPDKPDPFVSFTEWAGSADEADFADL